MAVPLKYNLRNLVARKTSTGMTAFVIGLVVAVFLCVLALVQGVTRTLSVTASTRNVIAMRVGSQAEMQSVITRDQADQMQAMAGPERTAAGASFVSPELITLINVPREDGKSFSNVQVRGMAPIGIEIRPGVKIIDGRMFTAGTNEAIVSKNLSRRFAGMRVGDTLKTGSFRWVIVGLFDAQGSAYESEIWTDVRDLQQQTKRESVFVGLAAPDSTRRPPHRDQGRPAPQARGQDRAQVHDEQMVTGPRTALAFLCRHLHCHRRLRATNTMYAQAPRAPARSGRTGDRVLAAVDPRLLRPQADAVRSGLWGLPVPRLQPAPDAPDGHDELPTFPRSCSTSG
jgi:hypothetical protein